MHLRSCSSTPAAAPTADAMQTQQGACIHTARPRACQLQHAWWPGAVICQPICRQLSRMAWDGIRAGPFMNFHVGSRQAAPLWPLMSAARWGTWTTSPTLPSMHWLIWMPLRFEIPIDKEPAAASAAEMQHYFFQLLRSSLLSRAMPLGRPSLLQICPMDMGMPSQLQEQLQEQLLLLLSPVVSRLQDPSRTGVPKPLHLTACRHQLQSASLAAALIWGCRMQTAAAGPRQHEACLLLQKVKRSLLGLLNQHPQSSRASHLLKAPGRHGQRICMRNYWRPSGAQSPGTSDHLLCLLERKRHDRGHGQGTWMTTSCLFWLSLSRYA